MIDTDSLLTDGPPEDTEPRLLTLVSDPGNERVLEEWIAGHDEYVLVEDGDPETATFDLCILDAGGFEDYADILRRRKAEARPVLLPCLLLLPDADISVIEADDGEIADSVFRQTVDELVSMPIKQLELEWRTDAMLRLRSQSRQLASHRNRLALFKRAAESAGQAVYITDTDGTIEYVNPAFEEITGYDEAEVLGETAAILNSGEMSEQYYDGLWETVTSGEVWEERLINQRKDGEQYHAYQTIAPVMGTDGEPEKYVAIQSDITDRVESERELELFRDIVERIDDPIMLQDTDGRFRLVNEAVAEFAGMSKSELQGEDEYAFMDRAAAEYIEARKQQALDQERAVRYSLEPELPNHQGQTFSTVRYPWYDEDGSLAGTVAICRNVTDLKKRDQQLRIIDRVLRHNLRNGMNAIELFAGKIQTDADGDLSEYADRIVRKSERIRRTVDKQRSITEFLADPPVERELELVSLVEGITERIRDQYPGATVRCDLPDRCVAYATGALEHAIEELLENAIVHSDRENPTVEITITTNRTDDRVEVSVADDGPEIPEMERKILLDEADIEPLYHGSGLGLWLVNRIVSYSNGSLSYVENEPHGNIVRLTLPAGEEPAASEE